MKMLIIAGAARSLTGFRKPLIQALLDKGLTVHAAAPELTADSVTTIELNAMGVITHNIPMARTGVSPGADIKTLFSLWQLMRKVKPTHMLGYTIKPVIYGSFAAWLARVQHRFALITGLGYSFQENSYDTKRSRVRVIAQSLYRISLRRCQTVFFQNSDDEALFKELTIVSAKQNTVVVNGSGVNLNEYPHTPTPGYKYPKFLFVGRLLGDKGVREYAAAAALVKSKYPEVEFDLVGSIDINPAAIDQSELDGWIKDGRLNYIGRLKDVKPRVAACSVFVLPSYREGTPRAVLEAMSIGRAIITTDTAGCRETIVAGSNGYLVPVRNADALAKAMLHFIEQPELIYQMGLCSREIAEEKYDVHKVNKQMLKGMRL
ncbi:glycosyltransferase family 4 protein [Oceanisphaera arctica]|uniref:Glycosyltransferase family 1 protein n=1 Tax=Oceanisphaera arctica TaxID=641510 RepID=A0A2P5TIW3_9GAMM|nr:glycosyltransferase family 4 protein [Oceanisphaera arctica]PPL14806.1 glycosyltransferase family 1 protein [Oceanisphaera arctica]GHA22892.1 glycosyl transferase [Oceanisphaera arctica]